MSMSCGHGLGVAFAALLACVGPADAKFISLEEELQMEIAKAEAADRQREVCRAIVFVTILVSALLGLLTLVKDFLASQMPSDEKVHKGGSAGSFSITAMLTSIAGQRADTPSRGL
eukprot:CAMPEP_0178420868 /NCGR_PEP_ID=MMETSP0689_2-20121128/26355_1 /TAXON_ID=160604 /ORGANISM="Amphidinium massartii, Strain CS-259" /LENGTH=115 /DNA_ID=CAMNT_0020042365 /DNA_START=125 /DNA_END=472 /DNA_ORIENTATION=+